MPADHVLGDCYGVDSEGVTRVIIDPPTGADWPYSHYRTEQPLSVQSRIVPGHHRF